MKGREEAEAPNVVAKPQFTTTHWSVVLATADETSPEGVAALDQLCRCYWYPLYAFIRRRGYRPEDAQDLTQQFFAHLLRKNCFRRADPARGRFRTFLLHALEHFLINEWKYAHRLKRGGGAVCLSLDAERGEQRYANESVCDLTPEGAYEKLWAKTLLERVLGALEEEYKTAGNGCVFKELADLLWGKDASVSYAEIGGRLGMTEGTARGAMHRLRERFRTRLRAELAHTVARPEEVEEELRHLISVVTVNG